MLRRILQGDPGKASRFRDFEGRLPPLGAWLYLPVSVASTLRFKLTGVRAAIPWLGYRAIRRIAGLVGPGTRVLEFGSGFSTVWLARRGADVLSIETQDEWADRVEGHLAGVPGHKVRILRAEPPYTPDLLAGETFDFALVDGDGRDSAMATALSVVRPGGYVYLDNADVAWDTHRAARDLALRSGAVEWFVDFTPFHVFVSTGVLIRIGHPSHSTC
jgi:predicted O-methyltransferase YrrM